MDWYSKRKDDETKTNKNKTKSRKTTTNKQQTRINEVKMIIALGHLNLSHGRFLLCYKHLSMRRKSKCDRLPICTFPEA